MYYQSIEENAGGQKTVIFRRLFGNHHPDHIYMGSIGMLRGLTELYVNVAHFIVIIGWKYRNY